MNDSRRWIDLHLHTTASDGVLPPAEVVAAAARRGLAGVAVTDHDTVAGLAEAAAAAEQAALAFITGIELAAGGAAGELHLLGYGFDPAHAALRRTLELVRERRRERNETMLARLRACGVGQAVERLEGMPLETLGRPHLADALVAVGAARDRREAFARYVGKGGVAYVARRLLTAGEAIGAILSAGGVASLAHPSQLHCGSEPELRTIVERLADEGLAAIEAYHPDHDDRVTRWCVGIASRCGLLMTGGSDFHGLPGRPIAQAAVGFCGVRVTYELLERLRAALPRRAAAGSGAAEA